MHRTLLPVSEGRLVAPALEDGWRESSREHLPGACELRSDHLCFRTTVAEASRSWRTREAREMRPAMLGIALTLLVGCANGPWYWTRPGTTDAMFLADHQPCFETATIGYGAGSEAAYKGCMRSKGWTRVQGTGSQYPTVPHYRGPEGDDEFTVADQARFQSQRGEPSAPARRGSR